MFRAVRKLTETLKLSIVTNCNYNKTIRRLEWLLRHNIRMGVTKPTKHAAVYVLHSGIS